MEFVPLILSLVFNIFHLNCPFRCNESWYSQKGGLLRGCGFLKATEVFLDLSTCSCRWIVSEKAFPYRYEIWRRRLTVQRFVLSFQKSIKTWWSQGNFQKWSGCGGNQNSPLLYTHCANTNMTIPLSFLSLPRKIIHGKPRENADRWITGWDD